MLDRGERDQGVVGGAADLPGGDGGQARPKDAGSEPGGLLYRFVSMSGY